MHEMPHVPIISRRASPDAHGLYGLHSGIFRLPIEHGRDSGCRSRHPNVILLAGWWDHSMILQRALQPLESSSHSYWGGTRGYAEQGKRIGAWFAATALRVAYLKVTCTARNTYESQRSDHLVFGYNDAPADGKKRLAYLWYFETNSNASTSSFH